MNTDSSSSMLSNGPVGEYTSSMNSQQQPKVCFDECQYLHSKGEDIALCGLLLPTCF